jgi:hypothetical protein
MMIQLKNMSRRVIKNATREGDREILKMRYSGFVTMLRVISEENVLIDLEGRL